MYRPKIFVAENVKALLHRNNTKSLTRVIKDFTNLGYKTQYALYNAADFGVPQTRERVFIVGTLDKPFYHPIGLLKKNEWVTAKEAIDDLRLLPKDEKWSHNWSIAKVSGEQGNRSLKENRPGYTIRAECHGNTHFHYSQKRRISNREAARLQSFPDNFILNGKLRDAERQLGNAVPPVLGWHVARAVAAFLDGKETEQSQLQLRMAI